MYECPIVITTMGDFAEEQMVERDNAIVVKIQEKIGIDVDKEELIKALNYDRHQYEKGHAEGYADAKAEYEPKWIDVKKRLPEKAGEYLILCREESELHRLVHFNTYINMYYPNSKPDSWERWNNDYYDKSKVIAWMPIPKYEEME